MKITKLGHCAMVLQVNGLAILTDPGSFSIDAQCNQTGIDVILITHEHQDHVHVESLKQILANNPRAVIVANSSVAALIAKESIEAPVTVVGDGQSTEIHGVAIEGFGTEHAEIYGEMGLVENTGYLVAKQFYFPGDNFHNPGRPVDVLALPIAGPWMKMSMAIDFAKEMKARTAFGVHDGMIQPFFREFISKALALFVPETTYISLKDGETRDF